ncbi:MAG: ABC transporter permease [Streptosporangiales bacterium]
MSVTVAREIDAAPDAARRETGLLRRALGQARARVGLVLAGLVVLVALVGPVVAPYAGTETVGEPFQAQGGQAILGTDNLGRDVFSRFLWGGRTVLALAVLCTAVGVAIGAFVGLVAGYTRTWVDGLLARLGDIVLAFPQVVLALLFLAVWGPHPWVIVAAIGLAHAPRTARTVRSAVLGVAERDHVEAAEAIGLRRWRVRLADVVPNIAGPLLTETGRRFAYSVALVTGLGVVGLGVQPPVAGWGLMIHENLAAMAVRPWPVLLPAIAIGLLAAGVSLLGDGIARGCEQGGME